MFYLFNFNIYKVLNRDSYRKEENIGLIVNRFLFYYF